MSAEDLKWMIGIAASAVLGVAVMLIAAFRSLAARIDTKTDDLHTRVNKVREDYVRRDDMDRHMSRIDGNVNELRREIRASHEDTNKRLDALLARLPVHEAGDHGELNKRLAVLLARLPQSD